MRSRWLESMGSDGGQPGMFRGAISCGVLLIACVLFHRGVAQAESGPLPCTRSLVFPSLPEIPANLPAFLVVPDMRATGAPSVGLYEQAGSGDLEQPVGVVDRGSGTFAVVPTDVLSVGSMYVLRISECGSVTEVSYLVRDAVPVPTELGATIASELLVSQPVPETRSYFVLVYLDLTDTARAARAMFGMDLSIDGVRPFDLSDRPRALDERPDRIEVDCGRGGSLSPGVHTFAHRATTWDGATTLETAPVTRELRCDDATRVHPVDYHVLTPEEIAAADGPSDAGTRLDGGVTRDGGVDDSGAAGCACRAGPPVHRSSSAFVVSALAVAVHLRARRRRAARSGFATERSEREPQSGR